MKKHVLLFGILGLILCFSMQAQISIKYSTGFETGNSTNYTLTGDHSYSTTVYSGGARSLVLKQSRTQEAVLLLDTIDLSQMTPASFQYATLEFMHICKIRPQSTVNPFPDGGPYGGFIEVRRIDEPTWTLLKTSHYDQAWGGGTGDFTTFFSERSYPADWDAGNNSIPTNAMWKKERFYLQSLFPTAGTSNSNKKLIVRFRLPVANPNNPTQNPIYYGWLLDNIQVKASPSSMVVPIIKMVDYPIPVNDKPARFPSSRDVKIKANITTTVAQGLNPDSVYIIYKQGKEPYARTLMQRQGSTSTWIGTIPFCGYDTVVAFHITAKDATTNKNEANFPSDRESYSYYASVRGVDVERNFSNGTSSSASFPFPIEGKAKSEYVYNKAALNALGYTYGTISRLQYQIVSGGGVLLNGFTIKMRNVDSSYVVPETGGSSTFYKDDMMKTVYQGNYSIPSGAGTVGTIQLTDTFYYAGQDILMQVYYNKNQNNSTATSIRAFPTAASKFSTYLNIDGTSGGDVNGYANGTSSTLRPDFKFKMNRNLPLMKDMGITQIIFPSLSTNANTPTAIQVSLKNMGVNTVNGVTIYYTVDGGATKAYNWTGTLAKDASTSVTVTTSAVFTPGYKKVVAWVGDTLKIGTNLYIDHEPFNDTARTTFIACAGPISGIRNVGGPAPDYNNLDELFEALLRCGVNGPLTVRLAPGTYVKQVTLPTINGTSSVNMITFEPMNGVNTVTINTPQSSTCALDLQNASYIKFKNILFTSRSNTTAAYLARLGVLSTGCIFDSCTFIDSTSLGITALLYSGGANNLTVKNCYFKGGKIGLNMSGLASDNCASNNAVLKSYFESPRESCVQVVNQIGVVVDSNEMNNTQINSSFVLLVRSCYGPSRIVNNKIYSSKGASCLGATDLKGSATGYAVIANNMFVTESETSSTIYTPVNIMNTEKMKYVYNSSKVNVPNANNISAATIGGNRATDVHILNNIFASMTEGNYAFNFIPTDTNYTIDHNLYYSTGNILNRYGNTQVPTYTAWKNLLYLANNTHKDTNSRLGNPVFMNITNVDLRSVNHIIQNAGIPIPEVTTDMFGTQRDLITPCVGAYESAPLRHNLGLERVISPVTSCSLGTEHIEVVLKNYGYATIPADSAIFYYIRNNAVAISEIINREILSMDTIHFRTRSTTDLSVTSFQSDQTFNFKLYTSLLTDEDHSNDTLRHVVQSLYQLPAPGNQTININYGTTVQLSVPSATGVVYWYGNDTATTAIHRGNTYQTDTLYSNITYSIAQRKELEVIKITEVQYNKNQPGLTYPYPSYMSVGTSIAVEMTNVGNYPVNLQGDSLLMISSTSSYNNRLVEFPDITILPGKTIVVQYVNGNVVDANTIYSGFGLSAISNTSTNIGIIYKRSGFGVKDAVVLNGLPNNWASYQVPTSIWTGNNQIATNAAGIRRINPNSNSSAGWIACDGSNMMSLGRVEDNMIVARDNGCLGYRSSVQVNVQNIPLVNLDVRSVSVSNQGCSLYDESISFELRNLGINTVSNPIVQYSVNGTLYPSDTIFQDLAGFASVSHTFSSLADLRSYNVNRTYDIKVWAHAVGGDIYRGNDTNRIQVESYYTPNIPDVDSLRQIQYGTRCTLYSNIPLTDTLAWYDRNNNLLHIGNTYITDTLYLNTSYYVSGLGVIHKGVHLGELEMACADGYPGPYQSRFKYRKEQYIITASELAALGYSQGIIARLSFYLDSVRIAGGKAVFENYEISMGTTMANFFQGSSAWMDVSLVYQRTNDTITNGQRGWRNHIFDTPFYWDGQSNVVVQVCYSLVQPSGNFGISTYYTTASSNSVLYANNATMPQCNTQMAGTSRTNRRPDMKFGFVDYACEGEAKQVRVELLNSPMVDAAAIDIMEFLATGNNSGQHPVKVVVKNYGIDSIRADSLRIQWRVDGILQPDTLWAGSLGPGAMDTIVLGYYTFLPGTHCIKINMQCPDDFYINNDTIEQCFAFCFPTSTQYIGIGKQYQTFASAIDALKDAGICGPVVFEVSTGVYNEQVSIPNIIGADQVNTITFRSASGSSSDVKIVYNPTIANNYVLKFDSTNNIIFENITIYAGSTTNPNTSTPATVVVIDNSRDIVLQGNLIRIKGTIVNSNKANAIELNRAVSNILIRRNHIDSGYVAIKNNIGAEYNLMDSITINSNKITNFQSAGISLRKVNGVSIIKNIIQTGTNLNNRELTGISLAEHYGAFDVQKNEIIMLDVRNGLKKGIRIAKAIGNSITPCQLYNNMVSISGTGTAQSYGICVDSSDYVNVYFNSTRVVGGMTTRGAEFGTNTNVFVKNNIFSNFGKGYAYYVKTLGGVSISDFNNYYSNSEPALPRFAYWGAEATSLTNLRALNHQDGSSIDNVVYFVADTNLRLSFATTLGSAEYLVDVTDDIDETVRLSIPRPCIGAYEFAPSLHDYAMMEILSPTMQTYCVESDSLLVRVRILNNGASLEPYATWSAYIEGTGCQSDQKVIPALSPQQVFIDSIYIPLSLGLIDTQTVVACISLPNDAASYNDCTNSKFYLQPAYNLQAMETTIDTSSGNCRMFNTIVKITVKNVGNKTIPTTMPMQIGYQATFKSSTGSTTSPPNLPTIPTQEIVYLPQPLAVNSTEVLTFTQTVDIYPYGLLKDIKVNLQSWAKLQYDVKPLNDTTGKKEVISLHTPVTPVGRDTIIPYGTKVKLFASQSQNRPIRWHRDSIATPFYEPTNYNLSTNYMMENIIFSDTVYYLSSISTSSCTSYYDKLNITVLPAVAVDAAPKRFEEPVNKIYMNKDTLKVRLVNYGTQAISNIPVTYKKHKSTDVNSELQKVTEICTNVIMPGEEYVFAFDSLLIFPNVPSQTYKVALWTDLTNEMTRENDTISTIITPINESTYCTPTVSNLKGLDITQVKFSTNVNYYPPIKNGYVNLVNYENPIIPTLTLYKGLTDTLSVAFQDNELYTSTKKGFVQAYIDWNRNGVFDANELVMKDSTTAGVPAKILVKVPETAYYGHRRMRIFVTEANYVHNPTNCPTLPEGCIQDYLVNIMKTPAANPALVRIVSPNKTLFYREDTVKTIKLLLANYGTNTLNGLTINYSYTPDTVLSHSYTWTGTLNSMESEVISLPAYRFPEGTTHFSAWIDYVGDQDTTNNRVFEEYHKFHVLKLEYKDNFDDFATKMYAPSGKTVYDRNYWECGTPAKNRITSAKSLPNAWTTDLDATVSSGAYGNRSIVYTPIFNIAQIKPDTLTFWMQRALAANTVVKIEYLNYMNKWKSVGMKNDPASNSWYTEETSFTGINSGNTYQKYWYPLTRISSTGDFSQYIQFRIIFIAEVGAAAGDGCAIDDFSIKRAQRAVDVGVVDIIHPTEPKFGQTIAPKVLIKNYGYDTIRSVNLAYHPTGSALPKRGTWTGILAPNDTAMYEFSQNMFTIQKTMPDTFNICAYTINEQDVYWDNDSTCKNFYLSPLHVDAGMGEFVLPIAEVIAGDSLRVAIRVRNFGETPLTIMPVSYSFNGNPSVVETIDFVELLGHSLGTFEYYTYTFQKKIYATMGSMELKAATLLEGDEYVYNDSLTTRIHGVSARTDITPVEIILSKSYNDTYVGVKILNIGSRSVNGFTVGLYYDNDPTTIIRETFVRREPFAALDTVIFVFDYILPNRESPYNVVTAFVNAVGDIDRSNDTTSLIVPGHTDVRADSVFVEENENPVCRVFLKITNIGTTVVTSSIPGRAVINGKQLSGTRPGPIMPGTSRYIEMSGTVDKSPTRTYSGSGIVMAANDAVASNNQTDIVVVTDYMQGVKDIVDMDNLLLKQNYPNPFKDKTTIEFTIPASGKVRFFVVNTLGTLIHQTNNYYEEGKHTIDFSYSNLSTGIYYYGIEFNGKRLMKKMVFRK